MRLVRARIKTVGRLSQRAKKHTHQAPVSGISLCAISSEWVNQGHERARRLSGLRPGARCADRLYAAHSLLLSGARLWRALSLGALRRGAVPAPDKAIVRMPGGLGHHGGAVSTGQG